MVDHRNQTWTLGGWIMGNPRPNHRLAKIHRNDTIKEIASFLGVYQNTVREWVKRGFQTIDTRRPVPGLGHTHVMGLGNESNQDRLEEMR